MTWNGRRLDWVNVAYFGGIHLAALSAPWYFSWKALGLLAFFTWLTCSIGICFTYHRLLTHRGFKIPKPLEYLFTVIGMLASEGGAVTWVARHRVHHAQSDKPGKDLHTPNDGFLWSHIGWIVAELETSNREYERRFAPELHADPVHRVMNRIHVLPNIALAVALYAWGGWSFVAWGIFMRLVVGLHATWLVNSAAHVWGYRTFDTPEGSRNLWWVGLLAWGEGWHNNHHAFQRSARHGLAWWEFDATWLAIRALAAAGLVKDIQLLPANAEKFRLSNRQPAAA